MKSAKLLRAELEHRNADSPVILKTLASLTDEQLVTKYAENRERGMEIQRRKSAGMASLIAALITCLIILTLAAAMLPNAFKMVQSREAQAAANTVQRIVYAESAFNTLFGSSAGVGIGYTDPSSLAVAKYNTIVSCTNPELLVGQDAQTQGVEGYTITVTGAGATTSAACSGINIYSSYTITATPFVPNGRYFVASSATSNIQFHDGVNGALQQYAVSASALPITSTIYIPYGSSGTGTGTCPSGEVGTPPNCAPSGSGPVEYTDTVPSFGIDIYAQTWSGPSFVAGGATAISVPAENCTGTAPCSVHPSPSEELGTFNSPLAVVYTGSAYNVTNFSVALTTTNSTGVSVALIDLDAILGGSACPNSGSSPNGPCNAGPGQTGVMYVFIPANTPANTPTSVTVASGVLTLTPNHHYTTRWTVQSAVGWTGGAKLTIG